MVSLTKKEQQTGFYDTSIHTTIPSGAHEITNADYTTFFSDQSKYTFEAQDSKAVLVELTTVYFTSDYGMTVVPLEVTRQLLMEL